MDAKDEIWNNNFISYKEEPLMSIKANYPETLQNPKNSKPWKFRLMEVTVLMEEFEGVAFLNVSKRRRFDAVFMQF